MCAVAQINKEIYVNKTPLFSWKNKYNTPKDGRMTAASTLTLPRLRGMVRVGVEESPGSTEKWRQVTPAWGDPRDSATENNRLALL